MRKRLSLFALSMVFLLSIFVCFVSCNHAPDPEDTATPITEVNINSDYKIIYHEKANKQATNLRKAIYNLCDKTPAMSSDASEPASPNEILIGNTGRAESTAFISELADYTYGVKILASENGTKILIAGKKDDYVADAMNIFIEQYLPKKGEGTALLKLEDTISENSDDKTKDTIMKAQPIQWEGDAAQYALQGGYARLCNLPDGKLGMAYSAGTSIKFSVSSDNGKTWSETYTVASIEKTPLGQIMSTANANVILMENGELMIAFRAHTSSNESYSEFYSSIRFCTSSDGGKTWSNDKIVAENTYKGSKFTGFWEPHMIYIKDGRLAMYYASDCIGGDAENYPFVKDMKYQHIIMHIFDKQTGMFGSPVIASNGEAHNSRDGMPVVCKLSDGSYAMVIESSVMREKYSFIIQILFSEDGIKWTEPKNVFIPSRIDNYAGAPFIVCLDDGRIAISFQGTEGSGTTIASDNVHNSAMNVIISNEKITYSDHDSIGTKSFKKVFYNPFPSTVKNAFSIWSSMLVRDGKLWCVTQYGYNKSSNATVNNGLYIRIGSIK